MVKQLSFSELNAGLPEILKSPQNPGVLEAIAIRPRTDERQLLETCQLSPKLGVHGDNWADGCWKSLPDGSPDPDVQVAIMNARAIDLIAVERERWELAGDNLFIDMDLRKKNLPVGQRLQVGTAMLEITSEPHNGCKKFATRFGTDAVKFVNSPEGKKLHLRGIYAKIVQAGVVSVGDTVEMVQI